MSESDNKDLKWKELKPLGKLAKFFAGFTWIPMIALWLLGYETMADILLFVWIVSGVVFWLATKAHEEAAGKFSN